mmetsp:Transcript_80285/g.213075  ORF Transcript_80285/g.213075 Transcript_80285/m.213075 type:complete len:262 (-) Transcript_80285:1133-1918(-)
MDGEHVEEHHLHRLLLEDEGVVDGVQAPDHTIPRVREQEPVQHAGEAGVRVLACVRNQVNHCGVHGVARGVLHSEVLLGRLEERDEGGQGVSLDVDRLDRHAVQGGDVGAAAIVRRPDGHHVQEVANEIAQDGQRAQGEGHGDQGAGRPAKPGEGDSHGREGHRERRGTAGDLVEQLHNLDFEHDSLRGTNGNPDARPGLVDGDVEHRRRGTRRDLVEPISQVGVDEALGRQGLLPVGKVDELDGERGQPLRYGLLREALA